MTDKQKRMIEIVERFQMYVSTYNSQLGYIDYSDKTFILDMIYGLGIALRSDDCRWGMGFRKFKKYLAGLLLNKEEVIV